MRDRLDYRRLAVLPLGVIAMAVPFLLSPYTLRLTNVGLFNALMVLGLTYVLGWTGLISLAQAGFVGIGAYTSAILTVDMGLNAWLGIVLGGVTAALFALIVGIPTLRLRTHYFAMATLGLGEIVRLILQNWEGMTRGADGIVGIPALRLGTLTLNSDFRYYFLLLAAVALAAFAAHRVRSSQYGRAMLAIRQGELTAEVLGVHVARVKLISFLLSAVYAGVAGALYAHLFRFISPDVFGLQLLIVAYVGLVLGGSGYISGGILGGVLVSFLPEWLRFLQGGYRAAVYGAMIVAILVFMPFGIVHLLRTWWGRLWPGWAGAGRSYGSA